MINRGVRWQVVLLAFALTFAFSCATVLFCEPDPRGLAGRRAFRLRCRRPEGGVELLEATRVLSRRPFLILAGALVAIAHLRGHRRRALLGLRAPPPETRVALDTPTSQAVTVAKQGADTLVWRAGLLADQMASEPIIDEIASEIGVSPDQIAVVDPYLATPTSLRNPSRARCTEGRLALRCAECPHGERRPLPADDHGRRGRPATWRRRSALQPPPPSVCARLLAGPHGGRAGLHGRARLAHARPDTAGQPWPPHRDRGRARVLLLLVRDRRDRASPAADMAYRSPPRTRPHRMSAEAGVAGEVRRGLVWSTVNSLVLRMGTLVLGMVLARLLAPAEFGVYAIALTVQSVLMTLADLGMSVDLVRAKDPARARADSRDSLSMLSGILLAGIMTVSAGPVARVCSTPRKLPLVIVVLSWTLVIGSAGVGAVCPLFSAISSSASCSPALATDFVVEHLRHVLGDRAGHGPHGAGHRPCGRPIVRYRDGVRAGQDATALRVRSRDRTGERSASGCRWLGANLLSWTVSPLSIHNVAIARVAGTAALGLYALAFNISSWPMSAIGQAVRGVSLAGFSRISKQDRSTEAWARRCRLLGPWRCPSERRSRPFRSRWWICSTARALGSPPPCWRRWACSAHCGSRST